MIQLTVYNLGCYYASSAPPAEVYVLVQPRLEHLRLQFVQRFALDDALRAVAMLEFRNSLATLLHGDAGSFQLVALLF